MQLKRTTFTDVNSNASVHYSPVNNIEESVVEKIKLDMNNININMASAPEPSTRERVFAQDL